MGILFQNLGTSPNASTFTSDVGSATKLLSSGQFATYLQQEIYEQSAMVRSGLLAPDARLSNIQGVIAEMPFAAPLDYDRRVRQLFKYLGHRWRKAVTTACKKRRPALNTLRS